MHRLLRTVFTWLLALALPLQGHAAQAMLFCGPAHERPTAVAAGGHDPAGHGHGGWQAAATTHGGWQAVAPSDAHDPAALGHSAASHHEQSGGSQAEPLDDPSAGSASQGKCSVCAACCSMAAIASNHALPGGAPRSFEYAISAFEPPAGRTAGGLERPPKSLLV